MVDPRALLQQTRRHFFGQCGLGLGSMALGSLLGEGRASAGEADGALEAQLHGLADGQPQHGVDHPVEVPGADHRERQVRAVASAADADRH